MSVVDPGDLFVLLYERLRRERPRRVDLDDWCHESDDERFVGELAVRITGSGGVAAEEVRRLTATPRGAFRVLRAVDRAFRAIDPLKEAGVTGLDALRQRWQETRQLNTGRTTGMVVFRRGYPARPQGVIDDLDGYLRGVLLVPHTEDRHLKVDSLVDIDPLTRLEDEALTFGCLSLINRLAEFDIARVDRGSGWYSIRVADDDQEWCAERVVSALRKLDDSGCHIAVLPELVLTEGLLAAWTRAIRQNPPPADGKLAWILAGSGPVPAADDHQPSPNRAIVLDRRTGEQVFHQDKRHPFTLSDMHIRKWKLTALGAGPLGEWMAEGSTNTIVESAMGRFTICICEDVGRVDEAIAVARPWGVSHVLVPIFAEPIRPHYWEQNSAERILNQVGSGVIISNSQAVVVDDMAAGVSSALFARVAPSAHGGPNSDWAAEPFQPPWDDDPLTVHTWTIPCA